MAISISNPGSIDPKSELALQETADATKQLVNLNKETSKQTKWMIIPTILIAFLTLIMVISVIKDFFIK